ncbi:hypothetical protein ACJJTC_008827 [Scirpophaga incertulas]
MCTLKGILRISLVHPYYPRKLFSSEPKRADIKHVAKVVNVAIIGAPNSGKSTLINNIVQRKICAASNKVHTTTNMVRALYFQNDTQIIFLDTPGLVTEQEKKKYNLPDSMILACHKSLRCANVIGVVHDVSNRYTKDILHKDVVHLLRMADDVPSFLILNKVDKVQSKKHLLSTIEKLTNGFIAGSRIPSLRKNKIFEEKGYSKFSDVFIVSALNSDGVNDVREYLLSNAKPAALHYAPEDWTDQEPETLIVDAVRAKFLDFLSQEIPYNIKVDMEYFEETVEGDKIICSVLAECPSERLVKLISGAGGGRLNQIKTSVRNDLMLMFQKSVVIDINLRTKPVKEL